MSEELKLRADGKRSNAMSFNAHIERAKHKLSERSVETSTGCLEYTRYKNSLGYGRLRFNGSKWIASRLAWFLYNWDIPEGMIVCHRCDNPSCVNVAHMFIGTDADNNHDAIVKGRINPVERAKERWKKCPTIRKS